MPRPPKLLVLSRSPSVTTTQRLVEAARARGLRTAVVPPLDCELHLEGKAGHVFYRRRRLPAADVVVPRIAQSIQAYGLSVLAQIGLTGATLVNGPEAIATSRHKMRLLQLFSAHGVGFPATVMAHDARVLKEMAPLLGGVPVLVKLLQGGERQGVMICETASSLEAAIETVLGLGQTLMIQQYVRGRDVRAMVVGGSVVCAVRRMARPNRLSHSLAQGARFEAIRLPAAAEAQAVAAVRLCGLEVAAVDLLLTEDGPKIFEIASSPGVKDMESATGVDVAGAIVDHSLHLYEARRERKKKPLPEPPPPARLPSARPTRRDAGERRRRLR